MLQIDPINTACSSSISYSFKGSKTKTIDLEMGDHLKMTKLDAPQADRFVIEKILHKEKVELSSIVKKPKFTPLYHKPEVNISNFDLAKSHEISDVTYEIGGVKCTIQT